MSFSRSNSTNYVSYKNHILLKEDYLAHILDSIGVKYYWYFVLMLENQWWCETRHIEALLSRVSVIVGSSKPVVITRTIGSEEKKKIAYAIYRLRVSAFFENWPLPTAEMDIYRHFQCYVYFLSHHDVLKKVLYWNNGLSVRCLLSRFFPRIN